MAGPGPPSETLGRGGEEGPTINRDLERKYIDTRRKRIFLCFDKRVRMSFLSYFFLHNTTFQGNNDRSSYQQRYFHLNEPKSRTLPYQDQIIFSKKSEQERGKSEGSLKASSKVSDPFISLKLDFLTSLSFWQL